MCSFSLYSFFHVISCLILIRFFCFRTYIYFFSISANLILKPFMLLLFMQLNGSTMLNLSLLTSDMWAVLIRIFAYHEKVSSKLWFFVSLFWLKQKQKQPYFWCEFMFPGWLVVFLSFCSCCCWPHCLFSVSKWNSAFLLLFTFIW